jgi:murein DD-endopeptidase MepM/ murein hydrolase activator NlpD
MPGTHLKNWERCVAGDLALGQDARRENILYGSSTDEQRSPSGKDSATLRAKLWPTAGGVALQSQNASAMLLRRVLPAVGESLAHSFPIFKMGSKKAFCMLVGGFACLGQMQAQEVIVARAEPPPVIPANKPATPQEHASSAVAATQTLPNAQSVNAPASKPQPPVVLKPVIVAKATAAPSPKSQIAATTISRPMIAAPSSSPVKLQSSAVVSATSAAKKAVPGLPDPRTMHLTRVEGPRSEPEAHMPLQSEDTRSFLRLPMETAFTKLADGFDFPVGRPDAVGYYKARGFRSHGHLGEDWDGIGGGDTDLGDPIYCIGEGIVVFARDCHMGWGNVVIVRHSYRENGQVKNIDSLYGHLDQILVRRGQLVGRGQKIATMGNAHGLYDAHLHLEIRKNIEIGMSRAAFAQDSSNYYDPSQFINAHRHLQGGGASYKVAMNTFVRDSRINWDAAKRNQRSRYRGSTRESAKNLKKAVAAKN